MSSLSPISDRVLAAGGHHARAELLLRLSDAVVLECAREIAAACTASGFDLGASYLDTRLAALCATRAPSGHLPDAEQARLEQLRLALFQQSRRDR
ncbi:hypothetical protein SAMN02983003_3150 [Devosia enhydra]|uniref:Uncharacterized protein n=1 Tax=Devosia enhydra TaxID=665118 RepID=A0A1K2I0R5_9HYPH|nr:hypothetical protein [Devosia enhydra]SFZ85978.1 hypothetical protein SAMN02983003_3150 [Devosia enhydra]